MGGNKLLRRLFYGLVILGILFFLSTLTLSYSTFNLWNDWDAKSVAYYQIQKENALEYFGRLGILAISWLAYWLILYAIIRQVYTKRTEGVFSTRRVKSGQHAASIDLPDY